MKRWLLAGAIFVLNLATFAQEESGTRFRYNYALDLTKVKNDQLTVNLKVDQFNEDKAIFNIPKIVPGTYEIYDFGRFVSDFTAIDTKGNTMEVKHPDVNIWVIGNAKQLSEISYKVEDTWDTQTEGPMVFEPVGTNFEKDKNFVLNMQGLFGYFEGMKQSPFSITVTKPDNFYASTGLQGIKSDGNKDVLQVANYMDLVDSPVMYNEPDTTFLKIGNTDVLVSVYSPEKLVSAKAVATEVEAILKAQQKYLGGKLPVEKYAFIIYLFGEMGGSGGVGALEHSYSSFYFLPEMPGNQLTTMIKETAAHEFFHIVTPLNIHSEEIGNFNYMKDVMSKHLWLYEGVVEYFAHHVQVISDITDMETYLGTLEKQMAQAGKYRSDISFTELSLGCTHEHKDEYMNVYQKGALIGLALDIKLLQLSDGKYGLRDLITDLSERYGKNKSFKDDSLFDVIEKLTYPEIRTFLENHVAGTEPLPLPELLKAVGIVYSDDEREEEFGLGGIGLGMNPSSGRLVVATLDEMNDFGRVMGYQVGDEIISVNGDELTMDNVYEVLAKIKYGTEEGDKVVVMVDRKVDGEPKKVKLKARAFPVAGAPRATLEVNKDATEAQNNLRKAWLSIE